MDPKNDPYQAYPLRLTPGADGRKHMEFDPAFKFLYFVWNLPVVGHDGMYSAIHLIASMS